MVELASVLHRHWPAYLAAHGDAILPSHRAAVAAVLRCRTAALGGQIYACGPCGQVRLVFHSCHHRACPRCGEPETAAWRDAQRARLLPVPYFLVTFTVPEELRPVFRSHQKAAYSLLFREAAATLQDVAADPRLLGAELGFLGVLHTWTRQLVYHPHIHFLVPGGGLTPDGRRWVNPPSPDYLLPGARLAARFCSRLREAFRAVPELAPAATGPHWRKTWVVNVQPAGRGETALDYLAAYVHRTALGSQRILSDDGHRILFRTATAKPISRRLSRSRPRSSSAAGSSMSCRAALSVSATTAGSVPPPAPGGSAFYASSSGNLPPAYGSPVRPRRCVLAVSGP